MQSTQKMKKTYQWQTEEAPERAKRLSTFLYSRPCLMFWKPINNVDWLSSFDRTVPSFWPKNQHNKESHTSIMHWATKGLMHPMFVQTFNTCYTLPRMTELRKINSVHRSSSFRLTKAVELHVRCEFPLRRFSFCSLSQFSARSRSNWEWNVGKYQNGTSYTRVSARHKWDARALLWVSVSKGFWAKNVLSPIFLPTLQLRTSLSMESVSLPFSYAYLYFTESPLPKPEPSSLTLFDKKRSIDSCS